MEITFSLNGRNEKKPTLVIYNLLRICLLLGCNKPNCSENVPKVIVFLRNGDFYICLLISSQDAH